MVLVLAASGCGGEDSGDSPADDPAIVAEAGRKIEAAATRVANSTRDRNLPGPYYVRSVCLTPEEAADQEAPRDSVQCHVEAFTEKGNAAVSGEDWRVAVKDGQVGEPRIVEKYAIRDFLRKDDRLDCSGGKVPKERCTGRYLDPSRGGVPVTPAQ